ncbi:MAG: Fur family transcriptional regulator [Opitutales bacterium]
MNPAEQGCDDWVQTVAAAWRATGHRFTPVRRILCSVIAEQSEAFEVESLLERARRQDRGISITTVYRTVGLLVESGFLEEQRGQDRRQLYFRRPGPGLGSSVIACRDCGKVFPYDEPCLVLRELPSIRARGFLADRLSLRVDARCRHAAGADGCPEQAK